MNACVSQPRVVAQLFKEFVAQRQRSFLKRDNLEIIHRLLQWYTIIQESQNHRSMHILGTARSSCIDIIQFFLLRIVLRPLKTPMRFRDEKLQAKPFFSKTLCVLQDFGIAKWCAVAWLEEYYTSLIFGWVSQPHHDIRVDDAWETHETPALLYIHVDELWHIMIIQPDAWSMVCVEECASLGCIWYILIILILCAIVIHCMQYHNCNIISYYIPITCYNV